MRYYIFFNCMSPAQTGVSDPGYNHQIRLHYYLLGSSGT